MTRKERIVHMILSEVVALAIAGFVVIVIYEQDIGKVSFFGIAMSLLSMIWIYGYNAIFDMVFSGDRLDRSAAVRVLHGVLFEITLTMVSTPFLMYLFDLGFWESLLANVGIMTLFMIYTIFFNWCFDLARHKLMGIRTNE